MLEIGQAIDVGIKRKDSENQDALLVLHGKMVNQHPSLLVVADGMGGYDGGAIASRLVVESFSKTYISSAAEQDFSKILLKCTYEAHKAIIEAGFDNPQLAWMGSTVVSVVIAGGALFLVNVGDSRAYLVNQKEIKQINWDHSLVADEIRKGNLTDKEARFYPQRNVLTMSLSARRYDIEPYLSSQQFNHGDIVVLCSDGLWGPVSEEQIRKTVLKNSPQAAAEKLVQLANQNGGPDNISVIVARQVISSQKPDDTRPMKI